MNIHNKVTLCDLVSRESGSMAELRLGLGPGRLHLGGGSYKPILVHCLGKHCENRLLKQSWVVLHIVAA